jgi:hypothetical protein
MVGVRENARGVCVARWYDPGTGQFMSADPDVAETGVPYAYAGDDPVNASDPTGLHWYNPCNWGGVCHKINEAIQQTVVGQILGDVRSTVSSKLSEAVATAQQAITTLEGDATSIIYTVTCVATALPEETWERWPDWFSYDSSGTYLAELAEYFPPLAFVNLGAIITVDRYGDVFLGAQAGLSGPGFQDTLDGGWIFNAHVPSHSDTKNFISSWSITGGYQFPPVGFSLVYGNVLSSGFHAWGLQLDAGDIIGKGLNVSASYDVFLGNIGISW